MHLQTPQYTTCTIKHHHAPHTYICTTFITRDISIPPKTIMYHEKFYVPHAQQCTTCTTIHHQTPHTPICTTCTTIHNVCHQTPLCTRKIFCTRKSSMYHMHHNEPHALQCTTKHYHAPIHIYVPCGPEYIHVYHKTPLCTRKILCTTCTSKHHMHQHEPPCTTYTYMYHIDHNRYICTTKNTMYKEKLYVPHAPQNTTMHHKTPPCTTKHHQK